jgi:hypothetical protein
MPQSCRNAIDGVAQRLSDPRQTVFIQQVRSEVQGHGCDRVSRATVYRVLADQTDGADWRPVRRGVRSRVHTDFRLSCVRLGARGLDFLFEPLHFAVVLSATGCQKLFQGSLFHSPRIVVIG